MQTASKYGVYSTTSIEEVARCGRAIAEVSLCQCDDRLYRYATSYTYSTGGRSGPIHTSTPGCATLDEARTAGVRELIRQLDRDWTLHSDSEETKRELAQLVVQLKARLAQPSLFDLVT